MEAKQSLLRKMFSEYYRSNADKIEPPKRLPNREFGFVLFHSQGMIRHVAFRELTELSRFMKTRTPMHAYYSSAYYRSPAEPTMERKEWLGADLVFDIDVDHIPSPCKKQHDVWSCLSCGEAGAGMPPDKCPRCGSERIKKETWVCETCIEIAKDEVLKLLDVLIDEFGLSKSEMYVAFSGHRGFHVHVEQNEVLGLTQDGRREIADYLLGQGLDLYQLLDNWGVIDAGKPGWPGRIARGIYEVLEEMDEEKLSKAGLRSQSIKLLTGKIDLILEAITQTGLDKKRLSRLGPATISRLAEIAARKTRCNIDEKVTIDVKRLIRLPGSLHGKTGFKVTRISCNEVEMFDPVKHAVVFNWSEHMILEVRNPPHRIVGFEFSRGSGRYKLPLPIAVYLIGNLPDKIVLLKTI